MYGTLRHRGADVEWNKCEVEKEEHYTDHTCTTLEDLEPMNCKRSRFELVDKGRVEDCRQFNNLISCEGGVCKALSTYFGKQEELSIKQALRIAEAATFF